MLNKLPRLAASFSWLLVFTAQLASCDPAEDTACADNTQCVTGQTCTAGSCVLAQTQAPTAGAGVGGNVSNPGVSGSGSGSGGVSSSGSGSGGTSSTGGVVTMGTSGSAGSSSSAGHGGSSSTAGSGQGGAAGGSAGGSSAGTSSGGAAGSGNQNTAGQCKDDFWAAANNGSVTRYDFKQGTSLPACTYVITHTGGGSDGDWDTVEGISTGDGGYFGAMNTTDYAQGAACGACVEASYSGRKVVLTIVDECPVGSNPKCTKGHIDLSRKAIRQLEPNSSQEDLHGVSWRYVKCPATGNVKARLHPNQNADWQPVVIENGLYPLKSVTLNGMNASRAGNTSGGNGWIVSGKKTPYAVRATDVNGGVVSFDFSGGTSLKDVGVQFTCK
jgi:expansin